MEPNQQNFFKDSFCIIDQSGMRCFFANIIYNIVRVLSLSKSYWAARNKIFIYARPCVSRMTWAFFYVTTEFPSC